ncbi:MAG: hypothetical protein ACREEN_00710 [Stellaceae bacterium]
MRSAASANCMKIHATTSKRSRPHAHTAKSAHSIASSMSSRAARPARLGERDRREIDRQNLQSLLGEEHAIAAFAVGDGVLTRPQIAGLRRQKPVGRRAEEIVFALEPRVPARQRLIRAHDRAR